MTALDFFNSRIGGPLLSFLPKRWAFKLAGELGLRQALHFQRNTLEAYARYLQVFYSVDAVTAKYWSGWHFRMLAREALDAFFLRRVARAEDLNWVSLESSCAEDFAALKATTDGAIIIMAHYGRPILLSSYLGLNGCKVGMLSQPIDASNSHLNPALRHFLQFKMRETVRLAGGLWFTTNDSYLSLARAIKAGERLIIMLDLPESDAARQVRVPFGRGNLLLPPGIVRLAKQTGAKLFYGCAEDCGTRAVCRITALPDIPAEAMIQAAAILDDNCRQKPWQWWQWHMLPLLWQDEAC
jgi:hypothetical protein